MNYVYRIFDGRGDLQYVGQTTDVEGRLRNHGKWMREHPGATVRVEGPFTQTRAHVIERRAIICEVPTRNRAWSVGREPNLATYVTICAKLTARYLLGRAAATEHDSALNILFETGLRPHQRCVEPETYFYRLLEIEHIYLAKHGEVPADIYEIGVAA